MLRIKCRLFIAVFLLFLSFFLISCLATNKNLYRVVNERYDLNKADIQELEKKISILNAQFEILRKQLLELDKLVQKETVDKKTARQSEEKKDDEYINYRLLYSDKAGENIFNQKCVKFCHEKQQEEKNLTIQPNIYSLSGWMLFLENDSYHKHILDKKEKKLIFEFFNQIL